MAATQSLVAVLCREPTKNELLSELYWGLRRNLNSWLPQRSPYIHSGNCTNSWPQKTVGTKQRICFAKRKSSLGSSPCQRATRNEVARMVQGEKRPPSWEKSPKILAHKKHMAHQWPLCFCRDCQELKRAPQAEVFVHVGHPRQQKKRKRQESPM